MGLARMRRWSRKVVAALLFATVCGLPHVSLDDTDCVIPVAAAYQPGDTAQSSFSAATAASSQKRSHCAICHWNRSARSQRSAVIVIAGEAAPSLVVPLVSRTAPPAPDLANLPARAPPTTLL
jgi:hypothetical protein